MRNNPRTDRQALWTIVLAAGEGSRLLPLTRMLHGEDLPKQFAVVQGRRSLLQQTLSRTAAFSPPERTVVVVPREWEALAREQTKQLEEVEVLPQPQNLGTGPGVLLPLSRVMAKAPEAIVAVVPSDHHVQDEERFNESIRNAEAVARREDAIVLVAAVPDGPETQYGWIVAAQPGEGGACRVAEFVEKPTSIVANELFAAGALWSTFIMVGPARRFWELAKEHLPAQAQAFDLCQRRTGGTFEPSGLSRTYDGMARADFSRDVLEKANALRVVPLRHCGWSDWGTPERVFRSLRGTRDYDVLVRRLAAGAPAPAPRPGSQHGTGEALQADASFMSERNLQRRSA